MRSAVVFTWLLLSAGVTAQELPVELKAQIGDPGNSVNAVAFFPDGKRILVGYDDANVLLWDIDSGLEVRRFVRSELADSISSDLRCLAVSANGTRVLAGGVSAVFIWEAGTGKQLAAIRRRPDSSSPAPPACPDFGSVEFSAEGAPVFLPEAVSRSVVFRATFSRDRKLAATGDSDGVARVIEVESGREVRRLTGHAGAITCIALSPDGRWLLTGSKDKNARVWDLVSGQLVSQVSAKSGIQAVAFSPDSSRAYLSTDNREDRARIWDVRSGKTLLQLEDGWATAAAFSPDGHLLLTGGIHGARLWDAETGQPVRGFGGWVNPVVAVAFSRDGQTISTAANLRSIAPLLYSGSTTALSEGSGIAVAAAWDTASSQVDLHRLDGCCTFLRDGRYALAAVSNEVRMWDRNLGKEARIFAAPAGSLVESTPATADDSRVAAGTLTGDVLLWDAASGRRLWQAKSDRGERVCGLSFSGDGAQLITGGDKGAAHLWNTATGKEMRRFVDPIVGRMHLGRLCSVALSPDGKSAFTGDTGGQMWDTASGREIWRLTYYPGTIDIPNIKCAVFSPDGRQLLTCSDGRATLWDAASGAKLRDFYGHVNSVEAAAFSSDGRRILTGGSDGVVRLVSTSSGALVATLMTFPDGAWAVVAPDGRFDTDNLDGGAGLHFIVPDKPFDPLPLEVFMRQYYTPRLLARLLAGENLLPLPSIGALNRVQPVVGAPIVEASSGQPRSVSVRIHLSEGDDGMRKSGIRDLRLFRDGQMVGYREGKLSAGDYTFDGIVLPSQKTVDFTAYAFNSDLVKSATAATSYRTPDNDVPAQPRAFLVHIGINHNAAPACDLQYAAADAESLSQVLSVALPRHEGKLLTSTVSDPNGASKSAVRQALADIAKQARPDDTFVLTFSGHGYTDEQGRFYLFPSDLAGDCRTVNAALLQSAISSDELEEWLRPIDAGEMVVILDACYSAASVQTGDFRPGPMDSQGLGQLAYDKRIRILAASQSTQAASETPWLGMGLLSYALAKDGFEGGQADWRPHDGAILLREWLAYGAARVPQLYDALRNAKTEEFHYSGRGIHLAGNPQAYQNKIEQTPVLFDFRPAVQSGPKLK